MLAKTTESLIENNKIVIAILVFFTAAIPSFITVASIQGMDPYFRTLFLSLSVMSFICVLSISNQLYKSLKNENSDVAIDKVEFFPTIGDLNNFYDNLSVNLPKKFDQVLTPGSILNTDKDLYIKCISAGGDGTRIIIIATLHDYLSAKRSCNHGNVKVIVISGYKTPFPHITLPSVTLADNNLLISYSNVSPSIAGRPVLLEDNKSITSRGVSIKISDKSRLEVIESYFKYLDKTSELSRVKVENIDDVKAILYKSSPHKYMLDVVTAISKEIVSICQAMPDEDGGRSRFLKYIGIIGSFAARCNEYYKNNSVKQFSDIDLLCVFTEEFSESMLVKIFNKVNTILSQCSIDNEINLVLENRIAPIKAFAIPESKKVIHLICVPEASLREGSVFSHYDRLNNYFDLWPYNNDSDSVIRNVYTVKEKDLNLNNLKTDKLGPSFLLEMLSNKRIESFEYSADSNCLAKTASHELSDSNIEIFSKYAVKWSLLNYTRCFDRTYTFSTFDELIRNFRKISPEFNYDFDSYDNGFDQSLALLETLVNHIENKTR